MPVLLKDGESLESRHKVSTKFGSGHLYVTNRALIIEIKKKGIVFHRVHTDMSGIEARALRTIRVRWPEGSQIHEFDFKAWGARDIVKQINARHRYTGNFSNDGASRVMFDDAQRVKIREQRAKWAAGMLKKQEKRQGKADKQYAKKKMREDDYREVCADTESWRQMGLYARGAACARLHGVPELIEDHLVWHDAWLDGNYFYTLNVTYTKHGGVRDGIIDEKTGAYRIPLSYVRFRRGYPYVRSDCLVKPSTRSGVLIPSMTNDMLDDELIAIRWAPRFHIEEGVAWNLYPPNREFEYTSKTTSDGERTWVESEARYLGRFMRTLPAKSRKLYNLPKYDPDEAARLLKKEPY